MIGHRLANLAILGLAAAICYGMQTSKPHYADLTGPIPVRGGMGDDVKARLFQLRVDKVEFAKILAVSEFGKDRTLTTGGLWAIVTVELAATNSTTTISEATWQGPTGLGYRETERLAMVSGLPPFTVEPGLPARGRFVFEVPPSEISGATLLVSNERAFALDSQARITLDGLRLKPDGTPEMVADIYDMDEPIQ
ncbi:hypothetical protein L598_003400000190 [Mesorhizobium sp. J18]|uniref:hypothetical protein n=1 Tax=Mesorhizobium sp. J18 TaxID=935263 RepID=UPI00119A431A|nr:hypothetical protein [Mesorhizobium sp. J18]TWG94757.1 hypothetical protein L598_003400000190 [Mesorhizobium sp. J18]